MFTTVTGPLMMSSTLDTYYRDCLLFASHKLQGNVILYIILYNQQSYNIAHKTYFHYLTTDSSIQILKFNNILIVLHCTINILFCLSLEIVKDKSDRKYCCLQIIHISTEFKV